MEAGEYGLTQGTCFVASSLEVVAVAGSLHTRHVGHIAFVVHSWQVHREFREQNKCILRQVCFG